MDPGTVPKGVVKSYPLGSLLQIVKTNWVTNGYPLVTMVTLVTPGLCLTPNELRVSSNHCLDADV